MRSLGRLCASSVPCWSGSGRCCSAQLEAAARHHGKLAAALAAQQRRNARLQLRWTGELRRLRRLLEGGAGPVAKQPPAGEPLQLTAAAAVDDGPQVVLGAMS